MVDRTGKEVVVVGSLQDMSNKQGTNLAESFMSAEKIVILDSSGSMDIKDVPTKDMTVASDDPRYGRPNGGRRRFDVATEELEKLQATFQGKIALVCFSDSAMFVPGGQPIFLSGGTALHKALEYVLPADGAIDFVVISDGVPDSQMAALAVAMRMTSKIDCIYIGGPRPEAEEFLRRLATTTKQPGIYVKSTADLLSNQIGTLLLKGGN